MITHRLGPAPYNIDALTMSHVFQALRIIEGRIDALHGRADRISNVERVKLMRERKSFLKLVLQKQLEEWEWRR